MSKIKISGGGPTTAGCAAILVLAAAAVLWPLLVAVTAR